MLVRAKRGIRIENREAREEFTQRVLRRSTEVTEKRKGREEHSQEWLCHKEEGPSKLGPYKVDI
jgi:hypothetical protein